MSNRFSASTCASLTEFGDKIAISPDGSQCLTQLDEEPGEPEEGQIYFYAHDGELKLWRPGEGTSEQIATGTGGGTSSPIGGDGSDGAITVSANTSYSATVNATTYTLNSGNTIYPGINLPLVVKATGDVVLNGAVNLAGRAYMEPA